MRHATYVIASTPRSGSSLLAAGVVATGVAGRPEEYFAADHIAAYNQDLHLPTEGPTTSERPWGLYQARPTPRRPAVDLTGVAPTREQITEMERSIDAEQAAWTSYFTARRTNVLTVRYEELDSNYHGEIARVLQFLGADPAHAAGVPRPPLERQSDHINEHCRRRIDEEDRRYPVQ